jgi:pilus assembly protein CpaF
MSQFLVAAVVAKVNIIFAGPTGAGKTTTLNVLSAFIPEDERILTIEDTAELHLRQDHVVGLEARQSNIEGKGEISIRELFKNSLRMRPDRIILGEIRGAEALDMLQAICSGHTGSLSVLHAQSPEDVINRLETMIVTSGIPLSLEVIHRQIASAVNIIVQQEQLVDGTRKITYITQVNGLKDGKIILEDIFRYEFEGLDSAGSAQGKWVATGIVPVVYGAFKKLGIEVPQELFNKG